MLPADSCLQWTLTLSIAQAGTLRFQWRFAADPAQGPVDSHEAPPKSCQPRQMLSILGEIAAFCLRHVKNRDLGGHHVRVCPISLLVSSKGTAAIARFSPYPTTALPQCVERFCRRLSLSVLECRSARADQAQRGL